MLPGVRRLLRGSRRLNSDLYRQKRIGETLDELRKFGYCVFDNLKHDGSDLEHIIVGPTGVFAVETCRGYHGNAESACDENVPQPTSENFSAEGSLGEQGSVNSEVETAVPASRNSGENREFDGWIWPLLIIAGEWRVKNDPRTTEARLFTIDNLVTHIMNRQARLTSTEIKLVASHLDRSGKLVVKIKKEESGQNVRLITGKPSSSAERPKL